ncbi:hypothetical protein [Alcanivorax sediminis]|uniref:hypothetical protein n=1 Tax=Alcanivorax sediminis TaxID=2663008 RepID=UPI001F1F6FCD|nr:hypothetical protein [Alcanivorax sediminis]
MRTFVLRARAASVNSQTLLANVGGDAHSEILAHTLMNAIFVAQSHREDVVVHLVLESTQDFSRTITFVAAEMRDIGGFHEQALLAKMVRALDASAGMGKEHRSEPGVRSCLFHLRHAARAAPYRIRIYRSVSWQYFYGRFL